MKTLAAWFTPKRRQLIQIFFASLAPIAIGLGVATQAQTEQWLVLIGAGLQFVASLLNLINLRGVWTIWTALRGAVYLAAATASPALVVIGVYDEATNTAVLLALSLGGSSLSALIAIFVGKDQEHAAEIFEIHEVEDLIAADADNLVPTQADEESVG